MLQKVAHRAYKFLLFFAGYIQQGIQWLYLCQDLSPYINYTVNLLASSVNKLVQVVNEVSDTSDISAGTKYRYELMDESDVNCQSRETAYDNVQIIICLRIRVIIRDVFVQDFIETLLFGKCLIYIVNGVLQYEIEPVV